jgi:hypothetical protein
VPVYILANNWCVLANLSEVKNCFCQCSACFNLEAETEHESNYKRAFRKAAMIKEINHWLPAIKER